MKEFDFAEEFMKNIFGGNESKNTDMIKSAKALKDVYDSFKSVGFTEEQIFRIMGLFIATIVSNDGFTNNIQKER